MSQPYIQRNSHQRRGGGCCLFIVIAAVLGVMLFVVLLPTLPSLVMGAIGFRPVGQTAQIYAQPVAPLRIQEGASAGTLNLNAPSIGSLALENAQSATVDGRAATIVRISETQLNVVCRTRTLICGSTPNPPLYDASIDLRPGGAIIRGMVYVAPLGIYQQAGLAIRVSGTQVTLSGVDFNGTLYALPESGLGTSAAELQLRAEEILRTVTANAAGQNLRLTEIHAEESTLTLVFR